MPPSIGGNDDIMISMYFGNPGSGKTTLACKILFQEQLKGNYDHYYANFETKLAEYNSLENLGHWTFPKNSLVVIDEAGIEYNSRKYKTMDQKLIEWLKLHRHYGCDVIVISQSWEDVDITIRRLVSQLYYIKKILCFSMVKRIYKSVGIDDKTHQIIDYYRFGSFFGNLIGAKNISFFFRPWYYQFFDSYHTPPTNVLPSLPFTPCTISTPLKIRFCRKLMKRNIRIKRLKAKGK